MGPERQLGRYDDVRLASGCTDVTYKSVTEEIGRRSLLAAFEVRPRNGHLPKIHVARIMES